MCEHALLPAPTSVSVWHTDLRHCVPLLLHWCCALHRYGGVVERPNIATQADWYLYSIQPLIDALG